MPNSAARRKRRPKREFICIARGCDKTKHFRSDLFCETHRAMTLEGEDFPTKQESFNQKQKAKMEKKV